MNQNDHSEDPASLAQPRRKRKLVRLAIICAPILVATAISLRFVASYRADGVWRQVQAEIDARVEAKLARIANKDPYDSPHLAYEFYLEQRTRGKDIDYGRLKAAKNQMSRMRAAGGKSVVWTDLGPGNFGGRTRALLINPGNADVMFAGGVAGGVWWTTDAGASWSPLDDTMTNLAVTTMVFEGQGGPSENPVRIYAGTGERFTGVGVRGAGIFKSTNFGGTWAQLPSTLGPDFHYVNKLAASPTVFSGIYAATTTGLWKSTDGGDSWILALANGGGGANGTLVTTPEGITDVEVRTDLGVDTLIASSGSNPSVDGVYRSTNAGANWTRVLFDTKMGRCDLAIAPSDQNYMYALCSDLTDHDGDLRPDHRVLNVYKSTNGGASFTPQIAGAFDQRKPKWLLLSNPRVANQSQCSAGAELLISQGSYDNIIAVAPHDRNLLFAGGVDLFKSFDGGVNWGILSYWSIDPAASEYIHADKHAIVFHPTWNGTSNQTMYVASDGGISKTFNAAATFSSGTVGTAEGGICYGNPAVNETLMQWSQLNNGYGVAQFYHGLPYPSNAVPQYAFGGTQDNGTLRGDNTDYDGWTELRGGDGGYVAMDSSDPDNIFVSTQFLSLSRSANGTDASPVFQPVSLTGITEVPSADMLFITPLRMDPLNAERIWTGGKFAWRSTNAISAPGAVLTTWEQASSFLGGFPASAWAIDPADSDHVIVGMSNGTVRMTDIATTSNGGTAWSDVSPPWAGEAYASSVEFDANDATGNTWYVTNSMFGAGEKVWRTTTDGASWDDITSNLPDIPAHTIAVQPGGSHNLYLGTDLGVFESHNQGGVWQDVTVPPFPNTVVENLAFQNGSILYAFTFGRGAWRGILDSPTPPTPTPTPLPHPAQVASLPFFDGFESPVLRGYWRVSGTNDFRVQLDTLLDPKTGSRQVILDDSVAGGTFSRTELNLCVDLAGRTGVELTFFAKEFSDEPHGPAATSPFIGGADFDGVAISEDGLLWHEVLGLRDLFSSYLLARTVNLDVEIARLGLSYDSDFWIRFNQFDNYPAISDGIALDDISITADATPTPTPTPTPIPHPIQAAALPFTEDFETGGFLPSWVLTDTGTNLVSPGLPNHGGSFAVVATGQGGQGPKGNELNLCIDLAGRTGVELRFFASRATEAPDGPPAIPYIGSAAHDGVAISEDGQTWYEVHGLRNLSMAYTERVVDLDAAIAAHGLSYSSTFWIRLNHYGEGFYPDNGILFDDITVTADPLTDPDCVYVDFAYVGVEHGTAALPFSTLAAALAVVNPGATIKIAPSSSGEKLTINQSVILTNNDGAMGLVEIGVNPP